MTIKSLIAKYRFNRAKKQIQKIRKYLASADNESAWAIHDEITEKLITPFQKAKNESLIQFMDKILLKFTDDVKRELGLSGDILGS